MTGQKIKSVINNLTPAKLLPGVVVFRGSSRDFMRSRILGSRFEILLISKSLNDKALGGTEGF